MPIIDICDGIPLALLGRVALPTRQPGPAVLPEVRWGAGKRPLELVAHNHAHITPFLDPDH